MIPIRICKNAVIQLEYVGEDVDTSGSLLEMQGV